MNGERRLVAGEIPDRPEWSIAVELERVTGGWITRSLTVHPTGPDTPRYGITKRMLVGISLAEIERMTTRGDEFLSNDDRCS